MEKTSGEQINACLSEPVRAKLDLIEVFSEIESTNSYLLAQSGPKPGRCRAVLADYQSAGRGRMGKVWESPRSAGLYLSVAYTFGKMPRKFSCLTLAVGLAVASGLRELGADGVKLKWPNDLVALDGKLGGILTELQPGKAEATTVVVGIGINLALDGQLDDIATGIGRVADLQQVMREQPDRQVVAAAIIEQLLPTLMHFEAEGFDAFYEQWQQLDWLHGKTLRVDTPHGHVEGTACGIDDDGALLVHIGDAVERVLSGTVTLLATHGDAQ